MMSLQLNTYMMVLEIISSMITIRNKKHINFLVPASNFTEHLLLSDVMVVSHTRVTPRFDGQVHICFRPFGHDRHER